MKRMRVVHMSMSKLSSISPRSQRRIVAWGRQFSDIKALREIPMGHPQWGAKCTRDIENFCDFKQI